MPTFRRILPLAAALLLAACNLAPSGTTVPTAAPSVTAAVPSAAPSETPPPASTSSPSPTPVPTLGVGSRLTSPVDGMVLDYVPAGDFLMGSASTDGDAYPDEMPQHSVNLDAFWIDQTPVTNGEYALCVQAGTCKAPRKITSNLIDLYWNDAKYANYPVIWISWVDAGTYCAWAGRRLPSEAEWEKAARGTDGRLYPWGNNPPDPTLADFANHLKDVNQVGSYPAGASPYGALDMAGNVWQWVADWYAPDYYAQSPASDPAGPAAGSLRVLRGGSFTYTAPGLRSAYRFEKDPSFDSWEIGFRCASSATP